MLSSSLLATVGSLFVGGAVAVVTVVSLVSAQTSPSGSSPTNVDKPVTVQYGN